ARTLLKHRNLSSIKPTLAFLGLAGEALVLIAAPWQLGGLSLVGYALATGALAAIPVVWVIFPVLHASHGAGFAIGLAKYLARPDWDEPERLPPADVPA